MSKDTFTTTKTIFVNLKSPQDKNIYNTKSPTVNVETIMTNLTIPDPLQTTTTTTTTSECQSITAETSTVDFCDIDDQLSLNNNCTLKIKNTEVTAFEISCLYGLIKDVQQQINDLNFQLLIAPPIPPGVIMEFPTEASNIPGYLYCDGRQYQQSLYSNLYNVIGDTYNLATYDAIDGPLQPGNFRVPDLQGLFTRMTTFNQTLTNIKIFDPRNDNQLTSSNITTVFTPNLDTNKYVSRIPYHSHNYAFSNNFPTYIFSSQAQTPLIARVKEPEANVQTLNLITMDSTITSNITKESVPRCFSISRFIKT